MEHEDKSFDSLDDGMEDSSDQTFRELPESQDLALKPLKFKLTSLQNPNLRYEVIYKNLLRDLRKFFIDDFNVTTDYSK